MRGGLGLCLSGWGGWVFRFVSGLDTAVVLVFVVALICGVHSKNGWDYSVRV